MKLDPGTRRAEILHVTVPAASALVVATICLFVAALFARLSRAPRGTPLRWFSLLASTAAITASGDSFGSLDVPGEVVVAANRVGLAAIGVHGAAWTHYLATIEGRPLSTLERALRSVLVAFAFAALVPGLVFSGEVGHHDVPWLGLRYQDSYPTPLGALYFVFLTISLGYPFLHWLRRVRVGGPGAAAHATGIGVLALTSANDALATVGVLPTPMLLEVGFLSVIGLAGTSLVKRFVAEGAQVQALRVELEQRVATRSLELETARHELERQERASSLGRLAGGLAHELNGPAAVVSSTLSFVREEDVSEEERRLALDDARGALARISRIVERLGRVGLAARPRAIPGRGLALEPLLESLVRDFADAPEGRVELTGCGPLVVRAEPGPLREILDELVRNALQALRRAGRTGLVSLQAAGADGRVQIVVDDDGPGIPAELHDTLLEPFANLARADERPALGLAATAGLVRALGGELELRPRATGGTRAVVSLPAGGEAA